MCIRAVVSIDQRLLFAMSDRASARLVKIGAYVRLCGLKLGKPLRGKVIPDKWQHAVHVRRLIGPFLIADIDYLQEAKHFVGDAVESQRLTVPCTPERRVIVRY